MATSIDDLLTVLDHATRTGSGGDALDAARALHYVNQTLSRVAEEGLGKGLPAYCHNAVRHLGESCADVATAFDQHAGRISDLAGALSDAIAAQRNELSDADRWAIAARLAPITRRCAAVIVSSGPYETVPELLAVGDRSRELQRAATAEPPELNRIRGLDAPIPSGHIEAGAHPDTVILEDLAALIGELRRNDRDPATVRELVAVCHVASRVANHFAATEDQGRRVADAWSNARDTIGLFADGIALPPPGAARSRILETAMRLETAIRHADQQPRGDRSEISAALRSGPRQCLRRLAVRCEAELVEIGATLCVPPGPRPLSDDRARQWLRKDTFRATQPDLFVAQASVRFAGHLSAARLGMELILSPAIA